jgi:DNA-binding NtrC family response regulator
MSEKINVYLIDDDDFVAQDVINTLGKKGNYNITHFATGELMLQDLKTNKNFPDIIILDYILNSQDENAQNGDVILERLRKDFKVGVRNMSVIMLSGQGEVQDAVNLLKKGAKDYIIKDDRKVDHLHKSIINILELRKIRGEKEMYMAQAKSLKKRLFITLGIAVTVIAALAVYFLFFFN